MAACCLAREGDSPALYESIGLQTSHAYSVLQASERQTHDCIHTTTITHNRPGAPMCMCTLTKS